MRPAVPHEAKGLLMPLQRHALRQSLATLHATLKRSEVPSYLPLLRHWHALPLAVRLAGSSDLPPGHVRDMRHWQQTSGTAAAPIAAAGALLLQACHIPDLGLLNIFYIQYSG